MPKNKGEIWLPNSIPINRTEKNLYVLYMYILNKSDRKGKKYMVITPDNKKIHFGNTGYQDYLSHKDDERKKRYILRHKKKENWKKSGINTSGWWSRWYSWNKKTSQESIKDIENKFHIKVYNKI